jgi:hypothetical protein
MTISKFPSCVYLHANHKDTRSVCLAYCSVPSIEPRWTIRFRTPELDDGDSSQFDEVAFWLLVCNSFTPCLTLGTEEANSSACAQKAS